MSHAKTAEQVACTCQTIAVFITGTPEDVPSRYRDFVTDTADADGKEGFMTLATSCDDLTWSKFAPGHDARIAGLLQIAARMGGEASIEEGGLLITASPVGLATSYLSEALAAKVAYVPKPRTPKAKVTKSVETQTVTAKVGRWEYPGTVDADGEFHYEAKDGSAKTAKVDSFTLVA